MNEFSPSDLKTIIHSKRANVYDLEHCRVLVNGGRVEYVTEQGKLRFWFDDAHRLDAAKLLAPTEN